jgi:hypothetical protein
VAASLQPDGQYISSESYWLYSTHVLYVCLQCRLVESITDFCWNPNGYNGQPPPPPPGSVVLDINVNLGAADSVPCPTTPAEWNTLYNDLNTVSDQVSLASAVVVNGEPRARIDRIQWAPIDSSTCAGARTQVRG